MTVKSYGAHAGDLPLEPIDITRRTPGGHDVQINIAYCGLCHSDIHQVHGEWPGMDEGQLIGPGDLAVTTDYRDVLSEILTKRLNNPATNEIFPEYQPKMPNLLK